jgi:hypothetical protein
MDALGLLGLGGTPAAAARRMALSQALLGLGVGMLGRGGTALPQSFASNLARGGAGFAAGLRNGIADARQAGLLGLGAADAPTQVAEPPPAANAAQPPADALDQLMPTPSAGQPAPESRMLIQVYDPSSPSGVRFVPRGQAVGRPGTAKAVPLPITDANSVGVIESIVAMGQPLWLKTPDGRVDQVTPDEATAWLQQHGLLA